MEGLECYRDLGIGGLVCNVSFEQYLPSDEHWRTLGAMGSDRFLPSRSDFNSRFRKAAFNLLFFFRFAAARARAEGRAVYVTWEKSPAASAE